MISVISPVYQAEKIIPELVRRIIAEVQQLTPEFEILLVEDGSIDNSWTAIETECTKDRHVRGIRLSRNFGQHAAITAGLEQAKGDVIVIMDCDLQDDPSDIKKLYAKASEGFDIVFTKRIDRQHAWLKGFSSAVYNKLLGYLTDGKYSIDTGSLVLFNRPVLQSIMRLSDQERLYIQMLKWVGFRSTHVAVEHKTRHSGQSSYTIKKLLQLAFSGMVAHSTKLLMISITVGVTLAILSFLLLLVIVVLYFIIQFQSGWVSTICAMLMSTGLILTSIGIQGLYIGKIYNQGKNRPIYIIQKQVN